MEIPWDAYVSEDELLRFGDFDPVNFPQLGGPAEQLQTASECQDCNQDGVLCDWHNAILHPGRPLKSSEPLAGWDLFTFEDVSPAPDTFGNEFEKLPTIEAIGTLLQLDIGLDSGAAGDESLSISRVLHEDRIEDSIQDMLAVGDLVSLSSDHKAHRHVQDQIEIGAGVGSSPHGCIATHKIGPVQSAPQTRRRACLRCSIAHQPASQFWFFS
ncbi:MAG: hypothetical protein MMC33_006836 [Icmadophila ericetorum]|nr:hypothetical protein [Icmadophila ericetorum]